MFVTITSRPFVRASRQCPPILSPAPGACVRGSATLHVRLWFSVAIRARQLRNGRRPPFLRLRPARARSVPRVYGCVVTLCVLCRPPGRRYIGVRACVFQALGPLCARSAGPRAVWGVCVLRTRRVRYAAALAACARAWCLPRWRARVCVCVYVRCVRCRRAAVGVCCAPRAPRDGRTHERASTLPVPSRPWVYIVRASGERDGAAAETVRSDLHNSCDHFFW